MEAPTRPRELADDPRALQVLTAEHASLVNARALVYNEAFTRASMVLTLVSMSFVGLALLAQATGVTRDLWLIAMVVLTFDLVIALLTFVRVASCNREDTVAVQGMNRIRAAYVRLAPPVRPYFTMGTTDDFAGILATYSAGTEADLSPIGSVIYGLSTSLGLVGLITAILGGLLGAIVTLAFSTETLVVVAVGVIVGLSLLIALVSWAYTSAMRFIGTLEVRYPSEPSAPVAPAPDA